MFDMLDDDLDDIGYVPTMMANSRSGNMKKLTKKQPKAAPKQTTTKTINNKSNDFDDLLDDLDFDIKKPAKPQQTKPAAPKANMFNSFDSQFDEPKPASLEKPKQTVKQTPPLAVNTSKASFLKFDQVDEIIQEDHSLSTFGKSQPNFNTKTEQPFVSSRNMKPPIKKKNDQSSQNLSFGAASIGLTIPAENTTKNLSLKNDDDDIIRPPPRLMNRRSSADAKSEKNDQPLSLPKTNNRSQSPINKFSLQIKKQQPPKQRQQLRLSLDEPKVQPIVSQKSEEISSFKVRFGEKEKETKPAQPEPPKQQKPIYKEEKPKKGLDMQVDQSITILKDSPGIYAQNFNKQTNEQYEKQIEQMRLTFQKQVDFLQQNLDRQITINKETRDKLMRESNKMIEQQRLRTKKIQEEEIKRLKEMFEWEKRRMEESFHAEIHNLRQSLEYAQKTNNYTFKTPTNSREDLEYLQNQLRHQKKLIDDRQRILQKRELEISEREAQLNKRRKKQEERLREEQKRILEHEMKMKKQLLEQKRLLNEEKQQMAIEVANLEIEAMKKKEKADYSIKQNLLEKQGLQNERFELRNQNAQLIARYKAKVEQVQNEKSRLKLIEADLVKKLRIVEQRLKETNTSSVNKTMYTKKQNNWIEDRDKSHQNLRSFSIQKHDGSKKMPGNHTKDRFYQLESNTKHKMNISVKENKKFDLDNYMMTVEEYKKLRGQA